MQRRLLAVCSIVLVALAGCSEPLGPTGLTGHYQLIRVNGKAPTGLLPAVRTPCAISLANSYAEIYAVDGDTLLYLQVWRGLSCPGFTGSGFEYDNMALFGLVSRTRSGLEVSVPAATDTLRFPMLSDASGLRLTIPDTLFGIAQPVILDFGLPMQLVAVTREP